MLSDKEIGRLTFGQFNRMLKAYQDVFTNESYMLKYGAGYSDLIQQNDDFENNVIEI